jgi:hypothetical protein
LIFNICWELKGGPELTSNVFSFDGSYVGRLFVNSTGKPSEILARLNKMARYDPDEEIGLYEVSLCCVFYCLSVLHSNLKP